MVYTWEQITEYNGADFFKCYRASQSALENGVNYDFKEHNTSEMRLASYKFRFKELVEAGKPHTLGWKVSDSSGTLTIGVGILGPVGHFKTQFWLVAPDGNNSRAYLYHEDYHRPSLAFWKEHGIEVIHGAFVNDDGNNTARNQIINSLPVNSLDHTIEDTSTVRVDLSSI